MAFSVLHSRAAFTETGAAGELKAVSSRLFPDEISLSFTPGFNRLYLERGIYSSNRLKGFASGNTCV